VQAVIEFNTAHKIKFRKTDVFSFFQVTERTGWRTISKDRPSARTRHNDPTLPETRGRNLKISKAQIKRMDDFIQNQGFEARILTWKQLAEACEIEGPSERTIQRAMGNYMHYSKWVSPSAARNRLHFAIEMLRKYPTPEAWRRVRFSDEVHFGLGPQGKLRVLRKPGERYCSDCIQETNEPKDEDCKRIHCWAAIRYNFKSEIVFYTTRSSNGKMT
jgi:hypothetical protein